MQWVKIVVLKTLREKRLTHLDVDALISAGNLGYVQARGRFDPSRGVKFKTFAEYRIRGAVLDEVRKMIGDERCKNKRPTQIFDYDLSLIGDSGVFAEHLESQFDVGRFFEEIPIDERSREILKCKIDGMNLKEIGKKFGFSESRASQLLAEIKTQVAPWFKGYLGDEFKLVSRSCPICNYSQDITEKADMFDCERCGADIVVVDDVTHPNFREVEENEE